MDKRNFKKYCFKLIFTAALLVIPAIPGFATSIVNSKHNLSATGSGQAHAVTETEICIFCHIPHNANAQSPLWSRNDTGQIYIPYSSTTSKASIGQPTGASKLCLSCHDGTVALGMIRSRPSVIQFTGALGQGKNLSTDLSDDHPVSFPYSSSLVFQNPELQNPASLTGPVRLDHSSQMQCTSCHDPHNDQFGNFLVMNGSHSNLCLQCHNKAGWTTALHNSSVKPFHGIPNLFNDPDWNTVAEYGCQSCHAPHSAGGKARLLYYAAEELNCLHCHNGTVALKNISAELSKSSIHPVASSTGLHDSAESALAGSPRHVECADCHNPHAAVANDQAPAGLPGALLLVKGVRADGSAVNQISQEYELCFRCHADTAGSHAYVSRQYPEMNTRREFDPANASFHPVETKGKNADVPSLIAPYTTASMITCGSCHNNNSGPNNSGTGPNGTHGSIYSPLLERQLLLSDNLPESYNTYALCYKCHSQSNILADRSFPEHNKHIRNVRAPCTACHDPHGVMNAAHLINFDRNIVSPDSQGRLLFEDLGRYHGRCYLTCHGENHNPFSY